MNKPDNTRDDELERYLAGDHPLSARYRQASDDAPPPELDAAIRRQAHESASRRHRRWLRPAAAAAVLILGVGMVLELQHRPAPRTEAFSITTNSVEMDAPQRQHSDSVPAAKPHTVPAPAPARPRSPARQRAPAALAGHAPTQPTIDAQIADIRQLLEAGKRDAAITALKHLLERHPDASLPNKLALLAATEELRKR